MVCSFYTFIFFILGYNIDTIQIIYNASNKKGRELKTYHSLVFYGKTYFNFENKKKVTARAF